MSEPMSNHEIEDVLSSIRRLVSEDLRPVAVRGPAASAGDKLILTPALRVVGEADPSAPVSVPMAENGAAVAVVAPPVSDAEMDAEPEVLETADDVSEDRDDLKSMLDGADTAEPLPEAVESAKDALVFHSARSVAVDVPPAPESPVQAPVDAFQALINGDPTAGWAETVTHIVPDLVEPDLVEPDHLALTPVEPESTHHVLPVVEDIGVEETVAEGWQGVWSDPSPSAFDATEDEPADVAPVLGTESSEPAEAPIWLEATEPDAGWAEVGEDWVEEQPVPFVATPPRRAPVSPDPLAKAWADQAEAAVRAELQDAAEAKMDDGLFVDEVGAFDEEALREIVRDIIREELAGTLGERITRNVRKLVRVEINRALAAREFE